MAVEAAEPEIELSLIHISVNYLSHFFEIISEQMDVDIVGNRRISVPEHFGQNFYITSSFIAIRRKSMSKYMKRLLFYISFLKSIFESVLQCTVTDRQMPVFLAAK